MTLRVTAGQVMSKPVRRLTMDASVADAAEFMRRSRISGTPVVDPHGRPVGVFSLRDLADYVQNRLVDLPTINPREERALKTGERIPLRAGFHFESFEDARVSDFMSPAFIWVRESDLLSEVISVMTSARIHRVFVKSASDDLVGVITTMDILKWLERNLVLLPKDKRKVIA